MPDDALERLQIVIEADASSVAPGAAQAANAMEQFGRRTTAATRAAAESVKRYKEAFSAAQKAARLDMQKSGVSDAMDKTARRLEMEQARLRELRAQAAHYAYKGDTSSTGARANAAKIAQSEARVADLDKQSESLARRFGALEDQARAQEQIASAATSRAEQAQQAAVAIAQQEEAERAQGSAAAESAQSTRAAALASEESAQGAKAAAEATREMNAEMRAARQGPGIFSSIGRALRSMLLIRSVTSMARSFVRWLWQAAMANAQFRASVASIKGNLISAFAPIYDAIIPWLNALASALANVTAWLSSFMQLIFGHGSSDTEKMLAGIGGAAGGASKEMKQLLANFDELNVLERSSGGSGGSGGGGGGGGGVGGAIANAITGGDSDGLINHPITGNLRMTVYFADRFANLLGRISPELQERYYTNKEAIQNVVSGMTLGDIGTRVQALWRNRAWEAAAENDFYREEMRPYDISGYASMSSEEYLRSRRTNRGSWVSNAAGEIARNLGELFGGIKDGIRNENFSRMGLPDPLAEFDLVTPALEEIEEQGRRTASTLRVGAGEVLGAVDAASAAAESLGKTWGELSLAEKLGLLGQAGAAALGNIASGLAGVQTGAETTSDGLNIVADAIERVKNNYKDWRESVRTLIDKQDYQWGVQNGLVDPQQLNAGAMKLNTYAKENYAASAAPSHGEITGPATYSGSSPTAADIAAAVAQGIKSLKLEVDGKTLGNVVQSAIGAAGRANGRVDMMI